VGVSFSYINEDFSLIRGLLDMVPIKEQKHTSANLASLVVDSITKYGIDHSKIASITQHNTGNCGTL
jgi:hypothetical protein